jgi:hypothetical protein
MPPVVIWVFRALIPLVIWDKIKKQFDKRWNNGA